MRTQVFISSGRCHERGPKTKSASPALIATLVFVGLALSGCTGQTGPSATVVPTATAAVVPSPRYTPGTEGGAPSWGGTDKTVTATCVVMSLIDTNLSNAEALFSDGSITAASHATVLNTVSSDLEVVAGDPGYGLQPQISALIAATAPTSKTLAGTSFDPHANTFLTPMSETTQACQANGSPLAIRDATNPYPNKP
jgi:hypothetical protein